MHFLWAGLPSGVNQLYLAFPPFGIARPQMPHFAMCVFSPAGGANLGCPRPRRPHRFVCASLPYRDPFLEAKTTITGENHGAGSTSTTRASGLRAAILAAISTALILVGGASGTDSSTNDRGPSLMM